MIRRYTQAALFAAFIALAGCRGGSEKAGNEAAGGDKPAVLVEVTKAEQRLMRLMLTIQGSFVPSQGSAAKLSPMVGGRLDRMLAREGDIVRKGQLLATVNTTVQRSQAQGAIAAGVGAEAQARQSQLTYRAAAADQASSVRSAELALETAKLDREGTITQDSLAYQSAQADLAKLRSGARPQEIAQARQAVIQARVARDRAQLELRRDQDLSKEGYVSRRQVEDSKAALDTAQSALSSAQASESLVRAGARPEELRSAELRMQAAKQALDNATAIGERHVAQAEAVLRQARQAELSVQAKLQDVQNSQSLVRQRQAEAAAAMATASLGEIRAPFDGRISRRNLNPGDPADTTTAVFEIVATNGSVDFVSSVPAQDAAKVRPGMEAIVGEMHGRVLSISSADPQTGLASIRIAMGARAPAGSFSSAQIVLKRIPNAVAVPKETLVDREGKSDVFRVLGEKAKMLEVTTGAEDGDFVEVKGELKPGDTLIKAGQYELSDGAAVKVGEAKSEAKDAKDDKESKP